VQSGLAVLRQNRDERRRGLGLALAFLFFFLSFSLFFPAASGGSVAGDVHGGHGMAAVGMQRLGGMQFAPVP